MLATLKDVGHDAHEATSVEEALALHGLDWDVELRQMFYPEDPTNRDSMLEANGTFAMVRTDTNAMIGRVGSDYFPCNNVAALHHVDHLLEKKAATLDSVFELQGGKRVGVSLKLKRRLNIAGDDPHELYVTVTTSHDGSRADTTDVTPIRIWCTNQLALSHREAKRSWAVKHLGSMEAQLAIVEDDLRRIEEYLEWFQQTGDNLVNKTLSKRGLLEIVRASVPFIHSEPTIERILTNVGSVWDTSELIGDDYRGTAWGGLNSVTEWIDHHRRYRSGEARYMTITNGFGARVRTNVTRELMSL